MKAFSRVFEINIAIFLLVFKSCLSVCFAESRSLTVEAVSSRSEFSTNTEISTNIERGEFSITGGLRSDNGASLFHSFTRFGVGENHSAIFINSDEAFSPRNIVSRIIGGEVSNIYGNLRTDGFNDVNLFLINPAGVVFGPNASLNIDGALHVITNNDIDLVEDTARFFSNPDYGNLLTIPEVMDFGFLTMPPLQGDLETSDSIQVLGTTLNQSQGNLSLIGKHINLTNAVIKVDNGSLFISGESLNIISSRGKANNIDINARTLSMAGSFLSTKTTSNQNSGNISINASHSVSIYGLSDIDSDQSRFFDVMIPTIPTVTTTLVGEGGKAGNIKISTPSLAITQHAGIFARALGSTGEAGNIVLTANHLAIKDGSEISTVALGEGGGNINIYSEFIVLGDDSKITASALGNGGAITINTDFLFNAPDSKISAQSAGAGSSIDGVIAVTAPDENIISSALSLSDTYLNMPVLASNPCASRTDSNGNSLVIRQSSGIAPEPDSMLSASHSSQYDQVPPVSLRTVGNSLVLSELRCQRERD